MTEKQDTQIKNTMPLAFQEAFFTVVPYNERPDFLPSKFNNSIHDSGLFERELFKTARHFCEEHDGGFWEIANVKAETGDTFFMYPATDKQYPLGYYNDEDEQCFDMLDNKIFGLIMTLITLNESSCRSDEEQDFALILSGHEQALYQAIEGYMVGVDDAEQHSQASAMFALIEKYAE